MLATSRARATAAIVAANLCFLLVAVAAGWPQWWVNVNYERSALTWFSSVQLLAIAACAFANAWLASVLGERPGETRREQHLWALVGGGFVFLALDERFQIHERVREGILKPRGIGTHIPGIHPGDFLLVLYAAVGLFLCVRLYRSFRGDRGTRAWLAASIALGLVATVLDVAELPPESGRLEQFVEEIAETLAQMAFLVTCVRHALRRASGARLVPA